MFTADVSNSQTGWHCFRIRLIYQSENRWVIASLEFKNLKNWFSKQWLHDAIVQWDIQLAEFKSYHIFIMKDNNRTEYVYQTVG